MKKTSSFLLAVAMVFTLFGGCSRSVKQADSSIADKVAVSTKCETKEMSEQSSVAEKTTQSLGIEEVEKDSIEELEQVSVTPTVCPQDDATELTTVYEFSDGVAWFEYYDITSDVAYLACMDADGNALFSLNRDTVYNFCNFYNGYAFVVLSDGKTVVTINQNGKKVHDIVCEEPILLGEGYFYDKKWITGFEDNYYQYDFYYFSNKSGMYMYTLERDSESEIVYMGNGVVGVADQEKKSNADFEEVQLIHLGDMSFVGSRTCKLGNGWWRNRFDDYGLYTDIYDNTGVWKNFYEFIEIDTLLSAELNFEYDAGDAFVYTNGREYSGDDYVEIKRKTTRGVYGEGQILYFGIAPTQIYDIKSGTSTLIDDASEFEQYISYSDIQNISVVHGYTLFKKKARMAHNIFYALI